MKKQPFSRKRVMLPVLGVLLIAAVLVLILFLRGCGGSVAAAPTVSIETPERMSQKWHEPFSLELRLTSLGEDIYPAASFCIGFDSARLEFLGIEEGNVLVSDPENSSGYKLPEWSVDVDRSNRTGRINLMYLDMTGGKYAFRKDALREDGNVVLRLRFRLRGSAVDGDIYELSFEDAIFAASDESKSLASSKNTLATANGRIIVGD